MTLIGYFSKTPWFVCVGPVVSWEDNTARFSGLKGEETTLARVLELRTSGFCVKHVTVAASVTM